jgi:hypothetical protein
MDLRPASDAHHVRSGGCGERAGDMDITAGTQLQEIGACISASTAPAVVP